MYAEQIPTKKTTYLLWTGGWDSTFRLLQLLLDQRISVTPYYLVSKRKSVRFEQKAMEMIRKTLVDSYSFVEELLQPTELFYLESINTNLEISEAHEAISSKKYLGNQYEILSRYFESIGMTDMELSIHKDDKAYNVIENYVKKSNDGVYHMDEKFKTSNEYKLFHFFNFPIFDLTKLQMAEISRNMGCDSIMEMTWFCHNPTNMGLACGKCNPCRYTIEEGLGRRIPFANRIFYSLFIGLRIIKGYLKKWRIRL